MWIYQSRVLTAIELFELTTGTQFRKMISERDLDQKKIAAAAADNVCNIDVVLGIMSLPKHAHVAHILHVIMLKGLQIMNVLIQTPL